MKNIGVLVSGGGTNLQAILDAVDAGKITGGRVALVLSSKPSAYALTRAEEHGIPTAVVDSAEYKHGDILDRDAFCRTIAERFAEYSIDLVVLAGFNFVLSHEFVALYPNRIMNVHPALIPSFCGKGFYGLHTHRAVLASGVKLTGATVHFVNDEADAGPIIAQKAVAVRHGDTPELLQRRVMEQAEWVILPEAIDLFCRDHIFIENGIAYVREDC
jgi:phosphoribosylglycinamide formyltransferase, formyltetrahydrofolate-dependent